MRRRVDTDAESGDDVRGVWSRAAAGVRVANGSYQRGASLAETRGAEWFGSGARHVVDGAGVRRRTASRRETEKGDEVRAIL